MSSRPYAPGRLLAGALTALLVVLLGGISLAAASPASAAICRTCDDGSGTPTSPVPPTSQAPTTGTLPATLTRGPQTDYIDGDTDQVMTTSVSWSRATNAFVASTRVTTHSFASGFTGGVVILAQTAAGQVVGFSQPQQWGVDATSIFWGTSDRTISWHGSLSGNPGSATSLVIVQWHWGKNRFLGDFTSIVNVLQAGVQSYQNIAPLTAMFI